MRYFNGFLAAPHPVQPFRLDQGTIKRAIETRRTGQDMFLSTGTRDCLFQEPHFSWAILIWVGARLDLAVRTAEACPPHALSVPCSREIFTLGAHFPPEILSLGCLWDASHELT